MISSSTKYEWYKLGDTVVIHAPQELAENGDLPDELEEWVRHYGHNAFIVHKIQTEDISGSIEKKPLYILQGPGIRMISPEGFYHEELRLVKSGQKDWDE